MCNKGKLTTLVSTSVLQSKRVHFDDGIHSAVFTDHTCISRVTISYSALSRVGLHLSEILGCNDLLCGQGMQKSTKILPVYYVRHSFYALHFS